MDTKPRVLVVEDNRSMQEIARLFLEEYATVVIAASIRSSLGELNSNPDFLCIILDGRVPDFDNEPVNNTNTLNLAWRIVNIYKIPAYSASSCEELNKKLAAAGCIHTNKQTALKAVRERLAVLEQKT